MQFRFTFRQVLGFLTVLFLGTGTMAQISIPNAAFTDAQDFSSLANTGTSSTVPTGWSFIEGGTNANGLYTAGTGSSNAGDTYSFGLVAPSTERALGGLRSGSLVPNFGVCYTNNTGATITSLTVTYTGEQWRFGTLGRNDKLDFQYNQNTTGINGAGTWTTVPALEYLAPTQASVGTNPAGGPWSTAVISSNIAGLSIAPGATFCFRWFDFDATGADDGLGVDDYSLTNITAPPPCEVIGFTFNNISACNDNGTPSNATDDYFMVDVDVLYSNSTNGDSLILTGGDLVFRYTRLALVGTNVTSTFNGVRFRADGNPVDFTGQVGTFGNIHCSLPGTGPAVNSCSSGGPASPPVVLTCPINTTVVSCQTQAAVNAQFAAWLATASGTGGCNGILTNNNTGAPPACGGTRTVTFTYTSTCAPFITTCMADFTVAAPPAFMLTCPTSTTAAACQTQAAVNAQFAAWLATASGTGGCNGALTNNNTGAPPACGGTTTVTFNYTTDCGSASCQATFTVASSAAPVLICPTPTTASACLTQAQMNTAYANWLASATVSGGCTGGTVTNNAPAAPLICNPNSRIITVTFTYAGAACQTAPVTCTSTFTVPAYPIFNVPANGASTVACPALIVQPMPPAVVDGCGKALTPTGPVIVNAPNPITCEGTRTFTWTYTDCAGLSRTWSHVTTVEREPFTIPVPFGNAIVDCPDDTDLVPTPPAVTSNCGEVLTPVITSTPKNACEGDRVYYFTYTDCEGNMAVWQFNYHIEYLDFTVPASQVVSVECPVNAILPTPPVVFDNCGNLLNPVGPAITTLPNAFGCDGSRTYAWTYTDCEGNTHTWSKRYNFLYSGDFFAPANEVNVVSCLAYAVAPFPQVLFDFCGQVIQVTGPTITQNISANGCTGTRTYSYVYRDCGGRTRPWSFTYIIEDNQAPVGTCPSGNSPVSVDVTNLACIDDVPCPDDYNFNSKIQELLAAGNYYDVCYGSQVFVTLVDDSGLWECSDPDGDGDFTFGRTFFFRITDRCGNAHPSLCEVTYSGACQPLETFSMAEWGIEGGAPGNTVSAATTDLSVITTLLGSGPVAVGGANRSITVNDAQCMMNLLPGTGGPAILANCQQVNCTGCNPMGIGGLKNALAANALALELNIRYNMQYNGLNRTNIRNQHLGCIDLHPCIVYCDATGNCRVHFFDAAGNELTGAYTIGGLQDLVNIYLNAGNTLTIGQKVIYGTALNQSLLELNSYFNQAADACDDASPDFSEIDKLFNEYNLDFANGTGVGEKPNIEIVPNPASNDVNIKLMDIAENAEVSLEIINALGQKVIVRKLGAVGYVNEQLDISGLGSGIYFVQVNAGDTRFEQKLVISKN